MLRSATMVDRLARLLGRNAVLRGGDPGRPCRRSPVRGGIPKSRFAGRAAGAGPSPACKAGNRPACNEVPRCRSARAVRCDPGMTRGGPRGPAEPRPAWRPQSRGTGLSGEWGSPLSARFVHRGRGRMRPLFPAEAGWRPHPTNAAGAVMRGCGRIRRACQQPPSAPTCPRRGRKDRWNTVRLDGRV